MALLGHVSAEMSLRYGRLFDATVRAEYERALDPGQGPARPGAARRADPAATGRHHRRRDWQDAPLIKSRLAGGYCLRTPAQGACAYANICEHCPNFRTDTSFLPILAAQRADAETLAADAAARGWGDEAARHRRLIERLDLLISPGPGRHDHDQPDPASRQACAELAAAGQPVTFSRRRRPRRHRPRHPLPAPRTARRHRGTPPTRPATPSPSPASPSRSTSSRRGLEALAANVRRHEEPSAASNAPAANPNRPGHPGTVIHSRGKISRITRGRPSA